jgi:phage terminase large subunit-like protein
MGATATIDALEDWTPAQLAELAAQPLYQFQPRPDCPEEFDQQTGFLNSRAKVVVAMGGNRSGKTETAAQKVARYMLCHQDPPRPDTPFVVVSDTYTQVGEICWKEKLSRILPKDSVDWSRVEWYSVKRGLPYVVPLRPRPGGNCNWSLEFRSVDQGRQHFQGRSFGGFWFSEQFPFDVFEECLARVSDYWFDGGQIAEFTPLDADLAVSIEERMDAQPPGWEFFRLNTLKNKTLAQGFTDAFFAAVSPELLATRQTGAMPTFLGAIYTNFNPAVHVLDEASWWRMFDRPPPERYCSELHELQRSFPPGFLFRRGLDWGESAEHPFVCIWGAKDGGGNWVIFDEYVEDTGTVLYRDREEEIKLRWPWPSQSNAHFGATYADPSRPLLIREFVDAGIPTQAAHNDVDAGIEYVRNALTVNKLTRQPGLVIYKPNCLRLTKEMRKYRWIRGVESGRNPHVAARCPLKWQDDTVDALRYLLYSDRHRGPNHEEAAPEVVTGSRFGVLLDSIRRKR